MLVLMRRAGESIVVGEDITITVLGVEGERVKLGVSAPRDVPILRQELCAAVSDENRAAVASPPDVREVVPWLRDVLMARRSPRS